jgi:fused signal recognition particle receptor
MVFRAIYDKIKKGLAKTRQAFGSVANLFRLGGRVDKSFLTQLEERLLQADVGPAATGQLVERVRQAFLDKEITGDVEAFVKNELRTLLAQAEPGLARNPNGPTVILVAGINGAGKTTSIAKLAKRLKDEGNKVIIAACDTFRAAAVEQLTIWSERLGCDIIKGVQGGKADAVAFDACEAAKARKADVLIVDTAGRLHTQDHLMKELEKIRRIISQQIPGAPHETLLVLDATSGQNAIKQAKDFQKRVLCTGIILAKLDGSAKGGAIIPIKQQVNLPVKFIGVGEQIDDLEPFRPDDYVEGLFAA